MKNSVLLAAFSLILVVTSMAQNHQKVTSKIDEVTVYLEGAIITRVANHQLNTGVSELLFIDFPPNLNSELIQVKADNSIKILDVNYRLLTSEEKTQKSLHSLNEKAKKLREESDQIAVKQAALQTDLNFIQDRNTLYRNNDNPTAQQMREMDGYLSQRRLTIRTEMLTLQQKQEQLNESLQKINAEIKETTLANLSATYVLAVRVEATSAGRKNFTINYYTPQAGWVPSYQVRVANLTAPISFELTASVDQESGEDWSDVQLKLSTGNPSVGADIPEMQIWPLRPNERYFPAKRRAPQAGRRAGSGQVVGYVLDQSTGAPVAFASLEFRDRQQQRYTFSADKEGRFTGKDLPVGFYNISISATGYSVVNEVVQIAKGRETNEVIYMNSNVDLNTGFIRGGRAATTSYFIDGVKNKSAGGVEDQELLQESVMNSVRSGNNKQSKVNREEIATAEEQFTTMLYAIEKRHSIPATGMPRDIQVSKASILADFVHVVRPALDEGAFLQAHITDWEGLRLLKGKASLYLEDAYMGNTIIDPLETSDTLSLSLGRDPQVIVKRERTLTSSSKSLFGSTVREQFSYTIEVRNTKKVPIQLLVEDQVPVSQHKDIVVSKIEVNPQIQVNAENGFLRWNVTLPANTNQELKFGFEVSRPRDMRLINLPIY
ncbi:MAG: mucoidy inhibitor MuiA family protein [Schleiferiaceae bacterium]|nr:mucoidy inhibitor MuiA family protein [Schleiferiaceae bacterium]